MKATTQKDKYAFDFSEETTLETWLLYWLDAYVKPVSKPSGYEHYRDNCVKHIIPAIGDIQLGNLTPRVLQRFFNEQARTGNLRDGGPLSTKSLRNMRAVLDVALKLATAEELMPSNPVPLTAIKSVKSRRVQIMTNEAQRTLELICSGIMAIRKPVSCWHCIPACGWGRSVRCAGKTTRLLLECCMLRVPFGASPTRMPTPGRRKPSWCSAA